MEDSFYNNLREHQLDAVRALCEVDKIFSENSIPYFLLAGSTLGAIRHKGFIPWDDDIDVGIFCEDKEKAYGLLKRIPAPFEWIDRTTDENYPRLYGKITKDHVGLMDVFIIVKTSNNGIGRRFQWINRKILFKLYKGKISYANDNETKNWREKCKVKAARFFSHFFSMNTLNRAIEKNERLFEHISNDYYLNLYSAYSLKKELIESALLNNLSEVSFEGKVFPTVGNPDKYLTHLYGDYMKLPDEKDRIFRHEELF